MALLRPVAQGISTIAALCLLFGCALSPNGANRIQANANLVEFRKPAPGTVAILFYRNANFAGGGRIHVLKLDDHEIGELTSDNYYRLEIWPGEYQFTVYLPPENFLGEINPPISISDRVRFGPADVGGVFAYQFTDGMGRRGFERRRLAGPLALIFKRSLSGSLSARDTAQVLTFLDARYDGPALNGQPHGKGTLTWPDGQVYQGVFEHGVPTNRARFFFTNGQIFMGLFSKGRPKSPGILMAPDGRILFAGQFIDEKPHGVGLRDGTETPEFCVYDHGQDTTKSFGQLAKEILDGEDQAQIEAFSQRIDHLTAQIEAAHERLFQLKTAQIINQNETDKHEVARLDRNILAMERARARMERNAETDLKLFIDKLHTTRWERETNKFAELRKDHRARVEDERIWCEEEFALGRNLCGCAPLATDFKNWQECMAPVGKRSVFY
jgi:hypothetical protein